jgi:hypothetical protein
MRMISNKRKKVFVNQNNHFKINKIKKLNKIIKYIEKVHILSYIIKNLKIRIQYLIIKISNKILLILILRKIAIIIINGL